MWRLLPLLFAGEIGALVYLWRSGTLRRVALAGAVVAAVVTLVVSDWYVRNEELDALVTATNSSESAIEDIYHPRVDAATQQWENSSRTDDDAAAAVAAYVDAANDALRALIVAEDGVRNVAAAPWHGSLKAAQDAMLEHISEWVEDLELVATLESLDRQELDRVFVVHPRIGATFEIAESDYEAATPRFALFKLSERIDAIFAE